MQQPAKQMYSNLDILNFALENGLLDADTIQCKMEMRKRQELLSKHNFDIWQGEKDKRWFTYLPDAEKPKGRVLKSRSTREALEDMIVEYYREVVTKPCFREVYFEWIQEKEEFREIEASSLCRYQNDFKRFFPADEPFCKIRLCDVTNSDLERFIKKTISQKELTVKAYSGLRTLLNGVFKYALREKYTDFSIALFFQDLALPKNIFKKVIKEKETQVFSLDEMRNLVSHLEQEESVKNLAVLLQIYTGMRVGELTALKPEDNKSKQCLHICRTEYNYYDKALKKRTMGVKDFPKTDESIRDILIPEAAQQVLDKLKALSAGSEYLISIDGKRVTSKQINYWLQKQCKEINILPRSTHKIRRSYISKLLSEKVDDAFVQGQAGHTDIATTQKYYHYCINSNKENLEKLNKIISF